MEKRVFLQISSALFEEIKVSPDGAAERRVLAGGPEGEVIMTLPSIRVAGGLGAAVEMAAELLKFEQPAIMKAAKAAKPKPSSTESKGKQAAPSPSSKGGAAAKAGKKPSAKAQHPQQDDEDAEVNAVSNLVLHEGESVVGTLAGFGRWTDYRYKNSDGSFQKRYGINLMVDGRNRRIWGSQLAEAVRTSGVKKGDLVRVTLLENPEGKAAKVFVIEPVAA